MKMLVVYILLGIANRILPSASVYWTISDKPVFYGKDITLTCETDHVLSLESTPNCPVRQWFGGPHNKLLLYNEFSANATKYVDNTNLSTTYFSMVIKDWNELDINLNYTCSCGFTSYTKPFVLSKENFVVFPKKKHVKIQKHNMTILVELNLERTYPKPDCHISLEEDKQRRLVLKSEKNGFFDDYECRQQIKISDNGCYKPRVVCQMMNSTIISRTGDEFGICTGDTTTINEMDSTSDKETTIWTYKKNKRLGATWTKKQNKPPGARNDTLTIVIAVSCVVAAAFAIAISLVIHNVANKRKKQNKNFKKSRNDSHCERGNKSPDSSDSSDGSNTSISPLVKKKQIEGNVMVKDELNSLYQHH